MPIEKLKSRSLPTVSVPVSRSKRTITFMPGPPATIMQRIPCQVSAVPTVVNKNMDELGVIIITDAQSVSSEGAVLTRKGRKQIYNNNMEQHRGKLKWKRSYSRNRMDEQQNNMYAAPSQENKVRPFYERTQSDRTSSRSKQLEAMEPERRRSENYTPPSTSTTKMKPWKSRQRSRLSRQPELPQGQMVSATRRRKTAPNASSPQILPYLNFSRRYVSPYTSREEINNSRPQIDAKFFDPLQQESKKAQSVPQATSRVSKTPLTIEISDQAAFDEVERESGMQHLRKRFLRSSKSEKLVKASTRSPYTSREEVNNPRPQMDASKFDPPQQESKKTISAPKATSRTNNPPLTSDITDQAAFDKDEREFGMQHLRKRFLRSSKSEKLAKASTRSLHISSRKLQASTNLPDGRQEPLSESLAQEQRQFEVKNTVSFTSQRRSSSNVIGADHKLHIDDAIHCCSTVMCSNLSKDKITEDTEHHPLSDEDNLQILTEGRCKYGTCNCDFCDQYDWLKHSRYSLETRQNNKHHPRILNRLYEIYTPYNPLDDEEFMTGYETQMSLIKKPTTEKKTQLRSSSNSISSLQQSSNLLQSMMKGTILAFERRESIVSSCSSIPEDMIQLTLPSCHSLPEDTINIVRLIPGNTHCCNCGISEENDGAPILWASVSYGIILCKKCALERISNNQKAPTSKYFSGEQIRCLVKENWSFFNILSILEGGNGKFQQFLKENSLETISQWHEVTEDEATLFTTYQSNLSQRVSQIFRNLGRVAPNIYEQKNRKDAVF